LKCCAVIFFHDAIFVHHPHHRTATSNLVRCGVIGLPHCLPQIGTEIRVGARIVTSPSSHAVCSSIYALAFIAPASSSCIDTVVMRWGSICVPAGQALLGAIQ
jgi:hypothetical protein